MWLQGKNLISVAPLRPQVTMFHGQQDTTFPWKVTGTGRCLAGYRASNVESVANLG